MAGRQTRRNRPPGEDAAKRDRAVKALDLRIGGATYRQIGAHLGVSECTAYHDVQDELGRLDAIGKEKAERLRELEIGRQPIEGCLYVSLILKRGWLLEQVASLTDVSVSQASTRALLN